MTEPLPTYQTNGDPVTLHLVDIGSLEDYYLLRRKVLADELRYVENVLAASGAIDTRLCKPGKRR